MPVLAAKLFSYNAMLEVFSSDQTATFLEDTLNLRSCASRNLMTAALSQTINIVILESMRVVDDDASSSKSGELVQGFGVSGNWFQKQR